MAGGLDSLVRRASPAQPTRRRAVGLCWMAALAIALLTLVCCLDRFVVVRTLLPDGPPRPIGLGSASDGAVLSLWARFGGGPEGRPVRLRVRAAGPDTPVDPDIFLVPVDAAGQHDWDRAYRIAPLHCAAGVCVYEDRTYLEPGLRGVDLIAPAGPPPRALEISSAELDLLAVRPFYRWIEPVLIALWIALGGATIRLALRSVQRRSEAVAAILVGLLFYAGTIMPAAYVHAGTALVKQAADLVAQHLGGWLPGGSAAADLPRRPVGAWLLEPEKLAHLSLSAALALFARRGFAGAFFPLAAALFGVVAGTELLQMMTLDRDPSLRDVGIDALGLLLGLAAARGTTSRPRVGRSGMVRSGRSS